MGGRTLFAAPLRGHRPRHPHPPGRPCHRQRPAGSLQHGRIPDRAGPALRLRCLRVATGRHARLTAPPRLRDAAQLHRHPARPGPRNAAQVLGHTAARARRGRRRSESALPAGLVPSGAAGRHICWRAARAAGADSGGRSGRGSAGAGAVCDHAVAGVAAFCDRGAHGRGERGGAAGRAERAGGCDAGGAGDAGGQCGSVCADDAGGAGQGGK